MCSESSWLFGFTDSREEDAMAGMLWCEQWWTLLPALSDSWCSSASRVDKVASVCHMVAYYMLSHQLITPRWTKHPFWNMKSRRRRCSWVVACSRSFTCYSGQVYQQRGARRYRECHSLKAVLSLLLNAERLRDKSGKEGAFQEKFSKSCAGSEK